jgi:hypothetical protein
MASKLLLTLVCGGLIVMAATILTALWWHRSAVGYATRLAELVARGETREARIQARNAGSALFPFLDALSGDAQRPATRSIRRDAVLMLLAMFPPTALWLAVGFGALRGPADVELASTAAGLMIATSILLPVALLACTTIVHFGARTSRAVRGACVPLMVEQLRTAQARERGEPRSTQPPAPARPDPAGDATS